MQLIERFWRAVTYFLGIASLSPLSDGDSVQIMGQIPLRPTGKLHHDTPHHGDRGPIFRPPGGRLGGDGSGFTCDYSRMIGYTQCPDQTDRTCWLTNNKGDTWDINTNYEGTFPNGDAYMPNGTTRPYKLDITNQGINADGLNFTLGKVFNGNYPGPWIQACWGDLIQINVTNSMTGNGTSIHWHGLRQWLSMHMDGVNGITQCPIKPGDYFVYEFNATQYGSSWYHSHYSIQYADGLIGPITIHGPTSQQYDVAPDQPLLMTDWIHNSAFSALSTRTFVYPSVLLNGIGDVNLWNNATIVDPSLIPTPYTLNFVNQTKPVKYLLRVINASFQTTFIFSIDNHLLTVVGADFVPIKGYTTSNILVGIGQRYHVIVEADPQANNGTQPPTDHNFWIRTSVPNEPCTSDADAPLNPGYEQTGILRYDNTSTSTPTSTRWFDVDLTCADEPYASFTPVVQWTVPPTPANGASGEQEEVAFVTATPTNFPLAVFALNPAGSSPLTALQINFGDPTFLHLDNNGTWNASSVVIPENHTATDWVYFAITGDGAHHGAHPIHLHGHDFAILQQAYNQTYNSSQLTLKYDNPPRRDVVLLPRNGFVVIAFKTDNPGAWLMHCHIAVHAAMGLGLQILERREAAEAIWPTGNSKALAEATRVCNNWNAWQANCSNWWDGCTPELFQDDSGV